MAQKDGSTTGDDAIAETGVRAEFAEVLTAIEQEPTPGRLFESARKLEDALREKQVAETAGIPDEALAETSRA